MANKEIRIALVNHGIRQYALADFMGVTETTMSKKLRKELSKEEKEKILAAIDQLAKGER